MGYIWGLLTSWDIQVVNDHIAGWNIPIFNRKFTSSIRLNPGPPFSSNRYVRWSRSVPGKPDLLKTGWHELGAGPMPSNAIMESEL